MGLGFDPDMRLQEAIRLIFARFRELGTARQVLLSLAADQLHFPRPSDGRRMIAFDWMPIRYRNAVSVLKNPFYADTYSTGSASIARRSSMGAPRRLMDMESRSRIGRSCSRIITKAISTGPSSNGTRSSSRRTPTAVSARSNPVVAAKRCWSVCLVAPDVAVASRSPVMDARDANLRFGATRCLTFGSSRVDTALARELPRTVEPIAVEAAMAAERLRMERVNERRRILELDLQQARYEASLAERRYAACDPDNRLIAAQSEKSWESALRQVEACQALLEPATHDITPIGRSISSRRSRTISRSCERQAIFQRRACCIWRNLY
jgi:hypothetical protein